MSSLTFKQNVERVKSTVDTPVGGRRPRRSSTATYSTRMMPGSEGLRLRIHLGIDTQHIFSQCGQEKFKWIFTSCIFSKQHVYDRAARTIVSASSNVIFCNFSPNQTIRQTQRCPPVSGRPGCEERVSIRRRRQRGRVCFSHPVSLHLPVSRSRQTASVTPLPRVCFVQTSTASSFSQSRGVKTLIGRRGPHEVTSSEAVPGCHRWPTMYALTCSLVTIMLSPASWSLLN